LLEASVAAGSDEQSPLMLLLLALRVGYQSRDATSVSVGHRDVIVDAGKMLTH